MKKRVTGKEMLAVLMEKYDVTEVSDLHQASGIPRANLYFWQQNPSKLVRRQTMDKYYPGDATPAPAPAPVPDIAAEISAMRQECAEVRGMLRVLLMLGQETSRFSAVMGRGKHESAVPGQKRKVAR